jgi:cobyrinic acid a,c-diamide synthase
MARCPALMVAAPASGQGKTSFTAALARLHRRAGRRVAVFKIGPDFLDPLLLEAACGAPVQQLDLWMCGEADVRARLHAAASEHELILVEGMMGLFDGAPSAADLAQRFGLPVLAVIDANALAQSFGAIALGLARYRPGLRLAGVAANRVASDWHAKLLRESLPPEIAWAGHLPERAALKLPERHLGLVPAAEQGDIEARIEALADALAESLGAAPPLPLAVEFENPEQPSIQPWLRGTRIAIARDAAFCFLYPANLQLLQAAGAQLQFFSPLAGEPVPECDAIWLPGGYPELHLPALSARTDLFEALRAHVEAGQPLLAECGGFLMLLDTLALGDAQAMPMAGLIEGSARVGARLAGLGMQEVELPEGRLRGHSFHHARAEVGLAPLTHAADPNGAPTSEAVYRRRRLTAGFMHFYFASNPQAACALFRP